MATKYITREITTYKYTFGQTMKADDGSITVGNLTEVICTSKLGPRVLDKVMAENGCNVLISCEEETENRRMSLQVFIANSEPYTPATRNASNNDQ